MRIISPYGTMDIPYDLVILRTGTDGGIHADYNGTSRRLALYTSEEKAKKVMKDVRDAYDNCYDIYQLPKEEEVKVDE